MFNWFLFIVSIFSCADALDWMNATYLNKIDVFLIIVINVPGIKKKLTTCHR